MTHPTVLTAVISTAGVLVAALLGHVAQSQGRMNARVGRLERSLAAAERKNAKLWAYTRSLIDLVYRLGGTPPPPPSYISRLYDYSADDDDDEDSDIPQAADHG